MTGKQSLSAGQRASIAQLAERLRARAGFRSDAIQPEVLWRVATPHLQEHDLSPSAPRMERALWEAMLVSETYFFRHPEHFLLVSDWGQQRLAEGQTCFRGWSAGCSSGEETFSMAASLLSLGEQIDVQVLGTDLNDERLRRARMGQYGGWSRRAAGPLLFPVGVTAGATFQVHPRVMDATRFLTHNLLDELPAKEGEFDVIFCRNVLVYLEDQNAKRVCRNLADRLRPGGILVLGNLDAQHAPPAMQRVGYADAFVLQRPSEQPRSLSAASKRKPPPPPARLEPVASSPPRADPIAKHVRALVQLERGHHREARRLLKELELSAPDYVPAMLEHALLSGRRGEHARAKQRMRELLAKLEGCPDEQLVLGPEALPVAFYRASAEAFLRAQGSKGHVP